MIKLIKKIFVEKAKNNFELKKIDIEIEKILLNTLVDNKELEITYTEKTNKRDKLKYKDSILNEVLEWVGVKNE